MDLDQLHQKVIAEARKAQPSDRVPYAFEKRVMARLLEHPVDTLSEWSAGLWRAALTCLAIVILSGAWAFWSSPTRQDADLSHEFDSAVFASVGSADEAW